MITNRIHLFSTQRTPVSDAAFCALETWGGTCYPSSVSMSRNPASGVRVEQDWNTLLSGPNDSAKFRKQIRTVYVSFPARSVIVSMARQIPSYLRTLIHAQGGLGLIQVSRHMGQILVLGISSSVELMIHRQDR